MFRGDFMFQITLASCQSMPKKLEPSVPKNTRVPPTAGVEPVGASISTVAVASPFSRSTMCSLASQPARKALPSTTVGEQRIWSPIEYFHTSLPVAASWQ